MQKYTFSQRSIFSIPGIPLAYWLSSDILKSFSHKKVSDYSYNKAGVVSGDDDYFIRFWYEPNFIDINKHRSTYPNYSKYHIFCKGGDFRRYYGNYLHVIKLSDLYNNEFANKSIRRGDKDSYFKKCITWSIIGSSSVKSFRCVENSICGTASPAIYILDETNLLYILGLLNSKFGELIINSINPTLNLQSSNVGKVPMLLDTDHYKIIDDLVRENVRLCKDDWDSSELSIDFQKHPLI